MDDFKPVISVLVAPSTVKKGQMISIVASIHDKNTGLLMEFDNIYLEIIDHDGIPVWPLSTVDVNTATISKLISTAELESGKTYTVRVSPSRSLRPIGEAVFKIEGEILDLLLIPAALLIPEMLLSTPESKRIDKVKSTGIEPLTPPKIAWLIYKTERDSRVCKYCIEYEGNRYRPDDPELPKIPIHRRCRCHYDVVSEEEEDQIYQAHLKKVLMLTYLIHQEAHDAAYAAFATW